MRPIRKYVIFLILGLLGLFVQGSLLKSFAPTSLIVPNLLLILVVFIGFYDSSVSAACLAFLIGLESDLANGILVGPWAAAFVAVYGMISSLSQRIFVESALAVMLASFVSSLVATFTFLAFIYQFRPSGLNLFSFTLVMFVEAIVTALVSPLIFKALKFFLIRRRPV